MQAQNPEANELRQALLASLLVSAWMVEARDPYTGGHLWRVARLAHALALHSGSTPHEASRIAVAGFLQSSRLKRQNSGIAQLFFKVMVCNWVPREQLFEDGPLNQSHIVRLSVLAGA